MHDACGSRLVEHAALVSSDNALSIVSSWTLDNRILEPLRETTTSGLAVSIQELQFGKQGRLFVLLLYYVWVLSGYATRRHSRRRELAGSENPNSSGSDDAYLVRDISPRCFTG
ncbi:hypothetical protein MPDQ_002015 [Monascus purpureus]|uniref:Uncharacterized protein n=1 Tax=Monascus purpureus TaxID=5098 RepID=A0A507R046_MONPU|nr:hypothetical protein MPDQ_002015 [Monascus purpureus]